MNQSQAIRNEACDLLSSMTQRIRNANLNNDDEWKIAVDSALNDMESASSLLNLVNDADAISGLHTMTKLSTWSKLLWSDGERWKRATGYAVECSCGHGDYHLVMSEPRAVRCVQRDCVIVLEYLPSA